jgi:hypothetical protein
MGLAGHEAHMGSEEVHTGFRWGDMRECDHLEELGEDGKKILICIFKK